MKNIKNFFCVMLLIVSTMGYSQNSSILSDELYLNYETAYVKYNNSVSLSVVQLDNAIVDFNKKFNNSKASANFDKSKDKIKWLTKNVKKTSFENAQQAVSAYTTIKKMEDYHSEAGEDIRKVFDDLLKKYDRDIIYNALKSRLIK